MLASVDMIAAWLSGVRPPGICYVFYFSTVFSLLRFSKNVHEMISEIVKLGFSREEIKIA